MRSRPYAKEFTAEYQSGGDGTESGGDLPALSSCEGLFFSVTEGRRVTRLSVL